VKPVRERFHHLRAEPEVVGGFDLGHERALKLLKAFGRQPYRMGKLPYLFSGNTWPE
jgi:hypothetical protein